MVAREWGFYYTDVGLRAKTDTSVHQEKGVDEPRRRNSTIEPLQFVRGQHSRHANSQCVLGCRLS